MIPGNQAGLQPASPWQRVNNTRTCNPKAVKEVPPGRLLRYHINRIADDLPPEHRNTRPWPDVPLLA